MSLWYWQKVWKFNLAIFIYRFAATRVLFRDGTRNFDDEAQMTKPSPELSHPSPNFCTTPEGGHSGLADLACTRPAITWFFGGSRSHTEIESLPPGHRGPQKA
ncbi:hypothetical protein AVEN_94621-1 [Araneus ventricosus]|uniref:Uncharacterized protein n=1 Tax=Araneus ventricosus TaxID=182803 RepID=A0A4Y2ME87_ARAVE|nr:hypothetical protein AVEN_94621-1 [Araneus ventricosus]